MTDNRLARKSYEASAAILGRADTFEPTISDMPGGETTDWQKCRENVGWLIVSVGTSCPSPQIPRTGDSAQQPLVQRRVGDCLCTTSPTASIVYLYPPMLREGRVAVDTTHLLRYPLAHDVHRRVVS